MSNSYSGRLGTAPEEAMKAPCVVASTSNITLSAAQTIGTTAVVAGDRVLVAGQTDSSENGIYDAAAGSWSRATDWNDSEDVVNGQLVFVPNAVYATVFTGTFSPGTTSVAFTSISTLPSNKTVYELSSDIASNQHSAIITGHQIDTNYYDATRNHGSGTTFAYTGVTTVGKAGNVPNADGYFYDLDGKQFETTGSPVSVLWFGADPTGNIAIDSLAAFHAAMTAHLTVEVPAGIYYFSAQIEIQQTYQRLLGTGQASTFLYPTHLGGNTLYNDAHSDVEIENLWIYVLDSSAGADDGVGYYHSGGAWLRLHDCDFFNPAGSTGSGTGVVLDDRDSAGSLVSGSYQHTLSRLNMSRGSQFLATGIKTAGTTGGINASRVTECHIISDNCIEWSAGGGNIISDNLLQSATGTIGTPAGIGVNGTNTCGHLMVAGNYCERFLTDVYNASTGGAFLAPTIVSHHSDLSTSLVGYGGGASSAGFAQDQNGIYAMTIYENEVTVASDSTVIPTTSACIRVVGNGAEKATCTLDNAASRDGEMLYIRGDSWSVQILEGTTADFGAYASNDGMIFGTAGAAITLGGLTRPLFRSALFTYNSATSKWNLLEATPHRAIAGNCEAVALTGNSQTVSTDARVVNLNGGGGARTLCVLEAPVIDGQQLTILAVSWAVDIVPSSTLVLASAASTVTFGNTTGQIMTMELIAFTGKFYEVSRTVT